MHTFHTYVIDIKYKFTYKLLWFRTGHQSAFRESFGSERASKCVSRVIWFRRGIQSAFCESFGSERGFKARFVSHLVQRRFKARVIWFRTGFKERFASHLVQNGLQSAFRESFWFKRGSSKAFREKFDSELESSKRVSRVNWFSSGLQSAFRESIG